MKKSIKLLMLASAATLLAACGGKGGDSVAPSVEPSEEAPSVEPSVDPSEEAGEVVNVTVTPFEGVSDVKLSLCHYDNDSWSFVDAFEPVDSIENLPFDPVNCTLKVTFTIAEDVEVGKVLLNDCASDSYYGGESAYFTLYEAGDYVVSFEAPAELDSKITLQSDERIAYAEFFVQGPSVEYYEVEYVDYDDFTELGYIRFAYEEGSTLIIVPVAVDGEEITGVEVNGVACAEDTYVNPFGLSVTQYVYEFTSAGEYVAVFSFAAHE